MLDRIGGVHQANDNFFDGPLVDTSLLGTAASRLARAKTPEHLTAPARVVPDLHLMLSELMTGRKNQPEV